MHVCRVKLIDVLVNYIYMLGFINITSSNATIITIIIVTLIIFSIISVVRRERGLVRIIWILIVLFLPILGSLIYLTTLLFSHKKSLNI